MLVLRELLKDGTHKQIWEKYCGFIDLTMDEFMEIQERLLLEQIDILYNCQLGQKVLKGKKPTTVKEFRQSIPFTTYDDYAEELINKQVDKLPSVPTYWIMTTWKGGSNEMKYAPVSQSMLEEHTKALIATILLSTSKRKEHFNIKEHDKFLYGMAPLPYLTGLAPHALQNEIDFEYLPSIQDAESMGFRERNKKGFELALNKGVDFFFGLSSVLVKIGEEFVASGTSDTKRKVKPESLKMAFKLGKVYFKKKVLKQTIYPKDVFDFKGIICTGTDSVAFKRRIEAYFGITPLEIFGGTEIATVAVETWSRKGLTFFPDVNFLEFIPEEESYKNLLDPSYVPNTVLLNELKVKEKYELVTTKFRGGVFVRYRVGDMIECVALNDIEHGIHLPQIRFVDRISNVIDIAGFTRITESTIETALQNANIGITDWVVKKEYEADEPKLHLYIELEKTIDLTGLEEVISQELKTLDFDYRDIEKLLGRNPLKLTVLSQGTIQSYKQNNYCFKLNPSKETIEGLLALRLA